MHWEHHKSCQPPQHTQKTTNGEFLLSIASCVNVGIPQQQKKVVKVTGKKCLICCYINGVEESVLWDSGAQVSMIDRRWQEKHLREIEVRPIEDLIE